MPKNSAEFSEMKAVLQVYYESNDWMENSIFIDKMKDLLGLPHQEPQAYTKKTQIPSYFGFTIWEDLSSNQSRRRITDSGKRFYKALLSDDIDSIQKELIHSLEHQTFGRNVCGCGSDSDIEPPQVFIKCVLALGFLTRQEYGYILWQLDEEKETLFDLVTRIAVNRIKDNINYIAIPPKYADAKPITALLNWNFLCRDGKIGSQDKIIINKNVLIKYIDRLQELRISNAEIQKLKVLNDSVETDDDINLTSINKIFYGAPGTGKSYKVDKIIKDLECRYFERLTFHPEFDNASFVGGYKPISSQDSEGKDIIKYKFVPQAFTNIYKRAWLDLENYYFLIIEEINRGNCAEIFGEIFQLLDRNSNYSVSPSKELKDFLVSEEGFNDSNHEGIIDGLKLPPNLSILATMNTSDQSLFPMDSAFKRRWEWEYVPICYTQIDDDGKPNSSFDFIIDIHNGKKYSWINFIEQINLNHIKINPSLGMDKCVGNYFIKPDNDLTISLKQFINKVIFYLWNDVFKDEENKVFEDNTSYEDFYPIETKGKSKIEELFNRIELKPITAVYSLDNQIQITKIAAEGTSEYENPN